ncbi:IQ domain-containing protein C isoform X1 [Zootoca vivipara]|uniref:IQ domain-containing protein C isoform X1 n=1 Tax=Zootoca vivipara TaxID=8524 RepID=UPI00158FA0C2|nr:IQ domain-containing protein C isoform X1 [Zootoca vivipara]
MTESEEEQQELTLRRRRRVVVTLQAHVRGYLVRKRFQSLKGEYESIVKEIEGDLDWLKWNRHSMPVPAFLPKSVQKPIKARELSVQEPGASKNKLHEKEAALCCQEELLSKKDPDCKMQLPSSLPPEVVAETEVEEECLVSRSPGNACSLPGESEEGKQHNSMSSEWSSMILNMESPKLSHELHFQKVPEMPQAVPDLQRYRKHLAMELLWLQQAIASRKNYLILKQKLGSPE